MAERPIAIELQEVVVDNGFTKDDEIPTREEIDLYPWKYIGYKGFASQIASDADFFAVRRFDRLHTRAILTLQAQLVDLEDKLDTLDKRFSGKNARLRTFGVEASEFVDLGLASDSTNREDELEEINNGSVRYDLPERAELVAQIIDKIRTYDQIVLDYSLMRGMGSAPGRNIANIGNWLQNHPGSIMEEEADFINHHDELVTVSQPKSPLRRCFEDKVVYPSRNCLALFQRDPHPSMQSHGEDNRYLIREAAIDLLASTAIFLTATIMLIAPLWILQTLQDSKTKLAVITIFVVVCLAFMSFALLGHPLARWAATAGYAAVLVVFLQLGNTI